MAKIDNFVGLSSTLFPTEGAQCADVSLPEGAGVATGGIEAMRAKPKQNRAEGRLGKVAQTSCL